MARYCPPARRRVTRCYAWVMSPAPSGASATGLAAVQLRRGVGHLGAVCLLLERSVLVEALPRGFLRSRASRILALRSSLAPFDSGIVPPGVGAITMSP